MSNYPPNQPIDYYGQAPVAKPRPTSVTVLAIIGIIFGSLGVLGGLCGLIMQFVQIGGPNPLNDALKANSTAYMVSTISSVISFIISALLLSGSIGSLSLKSAARGLMIAVAIASLAQQAIGLVLHFTLIAPLVENVLQNSGAAVASTVRMSMNIALAFGVLLGATLPVLILIFFTRPHVKAAFERGMPAAPQQPYYPQ